jgi:hypothetical protein
MKDIDVENLKWMLCTTPIEPPSLYTTSQDAIDAGRRKLAAYFIGSFAVYEVSVSKSKTIKGKP